MAENIEILSATQPDAPDQPELDQPEDQEVLSLDDVRAADRPEAQPGEQTTGEDTQAGDAGPQPEAAREQALTQAEFDRIFKERAGGLRRQFQREHSGELALAEVVRQAFPGMGPEQIEEVLLGEQARRLAEETGWDEDEAKRKIKARRQFERRGRVGDDEAPDPHLQLLQRQLQEVNAREGVDMLEIIQRDPYLSEQVNNGSMDIKDAYIHHMKNQAAQASPRRAPRVEKRASVAGARMERTLSDADMDRIDAALQAGRRVRLD